MLRITVIELEIQKVYTYWEFEEKTLMFCFKMTTIFEKDISGLVQMSSLLI